MRNKLERRRLALRAAALCFVLALLCSCLLPAFAEGAVPADSAPGQMQENEPDSELPAEEPPEKAESEEEAEEPELFPEEEEEPEEKSEESPADSEEPETEPDGDEPQEDFETVYLFWLSEEDEAEGALPYAEQTVGSGEELLLPEEPEVDGKQFHYWYSRDDEGTAVRFVLPEEPLRPEKDGERSLYAYFTAEETEDAAELEETDIPALTNPEEEQEPEEEKALPTADEEEQEKPEQTAAEEDAVQQEDEESLTEDEAEPLAAAVGERAAVFLLKTPTSHPESNEPNQWAPDGSECRWIGRVNTYRAVWNDGGRNITSGVEDCIVSWPDGSTDSVWVLGPGNDYWDEVVDEIWNQYRSSIEEATGITGLEKSDLEAITVTPYKISRKNGTDPDKHIDCTISVRSKKSFTARFNVRAPGGDEYETVDSREYRSGQRVQETEADIEQSISIGGVRYVFDGWYREKSGPAVDEPGTKKVTQDEWEEGYLPSDDELENGVVNFYAHYVLAEVQPDTGVTLSFFAAPLLLCAGAAGLCCHKLRKEDEE